MKYIGEDDYSDNMLKEDDIYMQNGSRLLNLDPKTKETNRLCDIELTFGDVTATIHNFQLDDTEYVELCKEDNVGYLIYEFRTSKKEASTLEDKQTIDAAEVAQAAANAKSSGSVSSSCVSSETSGYSET